jgi:delta24-sterol reductase
MTFAKQVFQDIVLPLNKLKEQVNTAIELFDTFPLLVYPCRIYDHNRKAQGQLRCPQKELIIPGTNYAMFNDLGVYGTPGSVKRRERYNPTKAMREMEKFTRDVGGYSFLYADIFMTESEFEEMFDLTLYRQVRQKYKADTAFPTLYDKVKPELDVISIGESYALKNNNP